MPDRATPLLPALIWLAFIQSVAHAAPGNLDPTFGSGGIVTTALGPAADRAYGTALQSDGKIVLAGFSSDGIGDDFALARYVPDGTLDTTFGNGGTMTTAIGAFSSAYGIAVSADGKLVAVGAANIGGSDDFAIARYNFDGTLDGTFGVGGVVTTPIGSAADIARAVVIQPDGKIVLAGVSEASGGFEFAVARFDTLGALDTAFGDAGIVTTPIGPRSDAYAVVLQADAKIVVVGSTFSPYDFALARYNPDGTLDTSFGAGGTVTTAMGSSDNSAFAVVLQPDAKIVAAGSACPFSPTGSPSCDFALARYNSDGALDASFGNGGIVTTAIGASADLANGVALQFDGKIVAAGTSFNGNDLDFAMVRYEGGLCGNGSVDGGEECDEGGANSALASCCTGLCGFRPGGETCRAAMAGCDTAETCTGTSGVCPGDVRSTAVCRPATDACDLQESCDGLSATCPPDVLQPDGTPCNDGAVCTQGETCTNGLCAGGVPVTCRACEACDAVAGCVAAPQIACRQPTVPRRAQLLVKDKMLDRGDKIVWKWLKGEQTVSGAFGNPLVTDDYTLCIYDASGGAPAVVFAATAPSGGLCDGRPCWAITTGGFRYVDRERTPEGLEKILLRPGDEGEAKIVVVGKGENLAMPVLPLNLPLLVQLQADNGQCWEASYSATGLIRNESGIFKGEGD